MSRNLKHLFALALIGSIFVAHVQCDANYVGAEDTFNLMVGNVYNFYFTSPSDYFVASVVTQPNQFTCSQVSVNVACSQYYFSSEGYGCENSRDPISSYVSPKGYQYFVTIAPKGNTNQKGQVSIFFQPLQDILLGETQTQNYSKHAKMFFRVNLTGSNKIFQISSPSLSKIKEIYIASQNCNDSTTGKSYSGLKFAIDVFKDCQVIFSLSSSSFDNALPFTPILIDKPLLTVQSNLTTIIPSGISEGQAYLPTYVRLDIQDLTQQFGFAAPMQLFLQFKGKNTNDKFTVTISSTTTLPQSDSNSYCINQNVCNVNYDIADGNSFFRYIALNPTMYVEGVDYILTALPVSFPPQGYQPTLFKSNRYLEFDFSGSKFQGVGVHYFEFVGRTAGDTSTIFENFSSTPFKYYGGSYNDNQLVYGYNYITSPTKIQEGLQITRFTQGYDFNQKFVPLFIYKKTAENIIIEKAWSTNFLTQQSYAAQLDSYANVSSASVRILLTGFTSADTFTFYVNDSTCNTNVFPNKNDYCKSAKNAQFIDYTYNIYLNKPVYFQLVQTAFSQGYNFSVIFNVSCNTGYQFNGSQCVSKNVS